MGSSLQSQDFIGKKILNYFKHNCNLIYLSKYIIVLSCDIIINLIKHHFILGLKKKTKNHNVFLIYRYIISFSLTLLLTWILVKRNPGFVSHSNKTLMDLLDAYSVDQICPDCSDVKPPRSRHCEICQKCVQKYDHHCPWLSNCIGEKNQYLFLAFLFTLILSMILQIVVECQILNIEKEQEQVEQSYVFQWITFYYTMIFGCIFILPVMLLFTVQIYNIIKGQTTYERYIEKQGINRIQSRKASAEQQLKQLKSAASTDSSDSEFKFTIKTQKKPLLKETELIV